MYAQPGYGSGGGGDVSSINPETHAWFAAVDVDRSGRITATELQQALTNGDWSTFSLETCKLIIKIFDRNNTGNIGIWEFQGILQYIRQWQGIFGQFDRDRSGFIEAQELHQALASMNYRLTPDFTSRLVYSGDPKSRQRISMDNFILICIKLHLYTESFKAKDIQMKGEIDLKYEELLTIVFENI